MVETQHHHRATLKQQNKPFKSKHSTKGAIKTAAKGRTVRQHGKSTNASSAAAQLKQNRKNAARQIQKNKRSELISATRLFSGRDGAARVVAVVPLCERLRADEVAKSVVGGWGGETEGCPKVGLWETKADRFKTSLQFLLLPYRQLYAALDACRVADYVIFVLSAETEVDSWGELCLRCLQAQGLPEVVTVVPDLEEVPAKQRPDTVKSLLSFIQYFVPTQSRVFALSQPSEATNAARALCEGKPKDVAWRRDRTWVLAEDVRWDAGEGMSGEGEVVVGTLKVTGVIRGGSLSANRLIHIPNFGDYQIEKITSAPRSSGNTDGMETSGELLAEPSSDADSLVSRNELDDMMNEQTWPTEEEMRPGEEMQAEAEEDEEVVMAKKLKRLPKGTSSYQAAWIMDEEDEEEGDESDEEDEREDDEDHGAENEELMASIPERELDGLDAPEEAPSVSGMDASSRRSEVHFDLPMEEEETQLMSYLDSRNRENKDDLEFPDEVDTPRDIPARTRFQRYRGLRSFRTSPWDPFENLPVDYARIFQFEDYARTRRRVLREDEDSIPEGKRVTLHLKNVPQAVLDASKTNFPFAVFALLKHEHKYSVLNFVVQRNTEYDDIVKSKDELVVCAGPRRYTAKPVYSEYLRGGGKGSNNVHKSERFLRHGSASVASVYAPIMFGKQPCLFLRESEDPQEPFLVATGTFMNPDTKRVVAKKIILTGVPYKVHKRTATIRYMFFNPEDIRYFAPIQLHTKHGRTGHISESLGTHGYFKAHFDGPITQMDTICMSLYKRIFPRWSEMWREPSRPPLEAEDDGMDTDD
ncbi:ribosome biogenesis protein tsr1 [Calocera cornea HHB12733]|uniref:Ribosome biogenesis protein tsr1 n=1 Tax=Calocera cornea HHB12733 TaxID=1353952 RepID=A0A165G363_9BASI|nr:ribosome biogenesis protein tsr1 [Calocera cornea HHB12733]